MADGEVTITLDADTERRLKAVAEASGLSVDAYVHALLVDALGEDDVSEDIRIADEAERTGASHSVQEAMSHFRGALHAQVTKTR